MPLKANLVPVRAMDLRTSAFVGLAMDRATEGAIGIRLLSIPYYSHTRTAMGQCRKFFRSTLSAARCGVAALKLTAALQGLLADS